MWYFSNKYKENSIQYPQINIPMLYIYNRNLQFLNTVINIKTKVLLPHATSTDFSCIAPKDFYTVAD